MFNLEPGEQRNVILVHFYAVDVLGHDMPHELVRLFVDAFGVDQKLTDVLVKIVADCANYQTRILIDEKRTSLLGCGVIDRTPQLQQITQVPLQFFYRPADTGRTRNRAHTLRYVELSNRFAHFVALFAFYAPRNTPTAGIVGHQNEVAAGKTDESRQRGAFFPALVLVNLDD